MEQHLRAFITVAEKQSFSRAAEELHLTQPAVTLHIQALEREVGAQLLERTNKYVRLTRAGEIVFAHAQRIHELYDQMQRYVDDLVHVASGPLLVGASYTLGEYVLPRILARLQRAYPAITPAVTIANTRAIAEQVAANQLEVGLVEGEVPPHQLQIAPLLHDELVAIAGIDHPLAQENEMEASQLSGQTWILRESGSGTRAITDQFLASARITPGKILEFGSTQMVKEAVEAGMGVALLSQWTIRKELALRSLRVLPVKSLPVTRQCFVINPPTRFRTSALIAFLTLLAEIAPVIAEDGARDQDLVRNG